MIKSIDCIVIYKFIIKKVSWNLVFTEVIKLCILVFYAKTCGLEAYISCQGLVHSMVDMLIRY